jgi:histidinol dehydrogenase
MSELTIVGAADAELAGFFESGWAAPPDISKGVCEIVAAVRERGDDALVEYERRWDCPGYEASMMRVVIPPEADSRALVPEEIAQGLALARDRVAAFHERQRRADVQYREPDGTRYAFLARPLDAVAAYVPGGSAALPSTAVMTVVPAKVAGVRRIAVFTPPRRDGSVHPAIVYASSLCGADELYAIGGAQAIAAAAYGTASVARVDKIVGPGNVWVTEAKRQVYGACAIDGLAGPSEVLVVADEIADPVDVAGELLAQAEHDPRARVAALSQSRELLRRIAAAIVAENVDTLARGEIVARVLRERCKLVLASSFEELCATIDRFAPEHLALRVKDPLRIIERVKHAGAIFVGGATPVACGDYLAGSDHVLPTSGSARFASGLRLDDFMRTFAVVENSAERIRHDAPVIAALAGYEGLEQHARTARARLQRE